MTENQYTKLVSVRIDIDLLKKLDDYAKNQYYFTRSSLINRILSKTIGTMNDEDFFNLIKH